MPQGTPRKRWSALLIAAWLSGCATSGPEPTEAAHPSVAGRAHVLAYEKSLEGAPLGAGDALKRLTVGRDWQPFQQPVSLGIRGDVMYVADAAAQAIYRYDLQSGRMDIVGNAGGKLQGDPGGMYVAEDLSFYITDPLGKRVLHFSPQGKLLQTYRNAPNLSRPAAVTVDKARSLVLVADEVYSHIVAFDQASGEAKFGIGRRGEGPGRFRVITDMVQTADDLLYVADRVELRLQVFDPQGRYIRHFGQDLIRFPEAIAVDGYGRVYVAERLDNRIRVFQDGDLVDVIGQNGSANGEFRLVTDMQVVDDKLYVADSLNQRIQIFRILPPATAETPANPDDA